VKEPLEGKFERTKY